MNKINERFRYSDQDGFTMYYIPSRSVRKQYIRCPLCNAILTENIFFKDMVSLIVDNKYPVVEGSRLLLSRDHTPSFDRKYIKFLYEMILKNGFIGLYDDPSIMSVPEHLHVELVNKEIFSLGNSVLQGRSPCMYTNYIIPLLAMDSGDLDLFLSVYTKLKNFKYRFNIIFCERIIFINFLSSSFKIKKIGAKECIGIFSTSNYDVFNNVRNNMKSVLRQGCFTINDFSSVAELLKI